MTEGTVERELPVDDIEPMVQTIKPDWGVLDATFVEDGQTAIYRLEVDAPTGRRECYLKAPPSRKRSCGIDTEARLTVIVGEHTDIPVPTVHGTVDDHDTLRAPFFLMESMVGRRLQMDALADLAEWQVRSLARQTGQVLGQLHDLPIPNVSGFGTGLTYHSDTTLRGGRPTGDPAELVIPQGDGRWRDRLEAWIDEDLEALAETDRFVDLVEPIRGSLEAMVAELPGDPTPVIARVDQGLWNVLTDEDVGRITALLDWGSLFVTPPAFDLAVTEYFLAGGPWIGLEDVPDHRAVMRDALLDGYRRHRPVPSAYDDQRRCYQLEAAILSLVSLDRGPETPRHVPADRLDEAAAGMRTVVGNLLV